MLPRTDRIVSTLAASFGPVDKKEEKSANSESTEAQVEIQSATNLRHELRPRRLGSKVDFKSGTIRWSQT